MTTNDTPTAEQLIRTQLEYITESPTPMYGDNTSNIETICESYLSLLDQLKIAKEALVDIAKWRESDGNIRRNIRQDIAIQAISKLTI